MSTFVIRFVDRPPGSFKGKVQHISTGEEVVFSSAPELIAFIEGITATRNPGVDAPLLSGPPSGRDVPGPHRVEARTDESE